MTWIGIGVLWVLLLLAGWVVLDKGLRSSKTVEHPGRDKHRPRIHNH